MSGIVLRPIGNCTPVQQLSVREIRNRDSVRKAMYTDHEIAIDEHLAWIQKLEGDDRQVVFVVFVDEKVSGVVSLNELDRRHRKSDWAFYLDENVRGGLGAAVEFRLLDFAFGEMMLEKLNCEVIETNEAVVKMHKKFGFAEEGFRRSNIEMNGDRIGVYFLGMTSQEWREKRVGLGEKYKSVLARFDLTVEYEHE